MWRDACLSSGRDESCNNYLNINKAALMLSIAILVIYFHGDLKLHMHASEFTWSSAVFMYYVHKKSLEEC